MKILDIRLTALSEYDFEIEVSEPLSDTVDVISTTSPQRTLLALMKEHGFKGKRGARTGWKRKSKIEELPTVDDLGFVDAGDLG